MSISERERQVLASIENDLTDTSPKLRSMLAMFGRLTEGEEMPARDRARRAFVVPAARGRRACPRSGIRPIMQPEIGSAGAGRGWQRLRRQAAWLAWLLIALAIMVWALTLDHGVGGAVCPLSRTAACGRLPAHKLPAHKLPGRARPAPLAPSPGWSDWASWVGGPGHIG